MNISTLTGTTHAGGTASGNRTFSAKEIAGIMGLSKQAIMKRAAKETWPYITNNGKGGNHYKYPLSSLPSYIQEVIIKDSGTSLAQMAEMLPVLSPSAAALVVRQCVEFVNSNQRSGSAESAHQKYPGHPAGCGSQAAHLDKGQAPVDRNRCR